jgi:uncharacterized protein (TIGR01777 family)
MRVVLTGASGLIGSRLAASLSARGDEVVPLGRHSGWDPLAGPAPSDLLGGADAVVHLAGENIAQRWSRAVKQRIRESRTTGTANLVTGLAAAQERPRVLVCANAVGYYGGRGDELLSEQSPPGEDWLAGVCGAWQEEAMRAGELGLRVCVLRTGVVLDRHGGALAKMLPAFQAGIGGPVAGGRQFMSWIHLDDLVALYVAAIEDDRYAGAVNAVAPDAVRNADFSHALGRALRRPAVAPVPGLALRMLYGEMAQIVTDSQNVEPRRLGEIGFAYAHPELGEALADALSR